MTWWHTCYFPLLPPLFRGLAKLAVAGDDWLRKQVTVQLVQLPLERVLCPPAADTLLAQPGARDAAKARVAVSAHWTAALAWPLASLAADRLTRLRRLVLQFVILPYFTQVRACAARRGPGA